MLYVVVVLTLTRTIKSVVTGHAPLEVFSTGALLATQVTCHQRSRPCCIQHNQSPCRCLLERRALAVVTDY